MRSLKLINADIRGTAILLGKIKRLTPQSPEAIKWRDKMLAHYRNKLHTLIKERGYWG